MESEGQNTVFWIERRRTGREKLNVTIQATPIDVGPVLRECLWSKLQTAVLTSATLAAGGNFEYIHRRLGIDHARESGPPSHLDYPPPALFSCPPACPDPATPQ